MRSIETLVHEFPQKTCAEIVIIQQMDKKYDAEQYELRHKKELELAKTLNTNGYFRGSFGLDQRYYYHFYNVSILNNGEMVCDIDKIVVLLNDKEDSELFKDCFTIKREKRGCQKLDRYYSSDLKQVTNNEWNDIIKYAQGISEFWKTAD